eukprot:Skav214404  [mRNA]  locus=scaffold4736:40280:46778:- [translate_table: standard]
MSLLNAQVLVQGLLATGMKLPEVAECCRIVAAVALLSDPELGWEIPGRGNGPGIFHVINDRSKCNFEDQHLDRVDWHRLVAA